MIEFEINKSKWKITQKPKEELLEKYNTEHEEKATYVFGVTSYPNHEIVINEELCFDQQIATLKHELAHCYIWSYGFYEVAQFNEELVCDIISASNDFINIVLDKYKKAIKG